MILIIWIFTTFGVVSVSFFTLVNLRLEKLNELNKDSKDDEKDESSY